jgi:phage protein U
MFAQLGEIQFDFIVSPDRMGSSRHYVFAEHPTIEGKPKLQYTGDALDELSIRMRFHAGFCDPAAQLLALKDAADLHQALPLIMGNGEYRGDYVIEGIDEEIEAAFDDGTVMEVGVSVRLKEWVRDKTLIVSGGGTKASDAALVKTDSVSSGALGDPDEAEMDEITRQ